jgi:hypothetical protein
MLEPQAFLGIDERMTVADIRARRGEAGPVGSGGEDSAVRGRCGDRG